MLSDTVRKDAQGVSHARGEKQLQDRVTLSGSAFPWNKTAQTPAAKPMAAPHPARKSRAKMLLQTSADWWTGIFLRERFRIHLGPLRDNEFHHHHRRRHHRRHRHRHGCECPPHLTSFVSFHPNDHGVGEVRLIPQ